MNILIWQVVLISFLLIESEGSEFRFRESYENGKYKVSLYSNNSQWRAIAYYAGLYGEHGFNYLEVVTNSNQTDLQQAYGAGSVEGFVTYTDIYYNWNNTVRNYCQNKVEVCKQINSFLKKNTDWIHIMINQEGNRSSIWHQIAIFYHQLQGIHDGYMERLKTEKIKGMELSINEFMWMNFYFTILELDDAFSGENVSKMLKGRDHCSAIIKLLSDRSDLLVAHNTWNTYTSMLRIIKRYIMPIHTSRDSTTIVPGTNMSFSSYPGAIISVDDFYVLSSGLVATETTIGNYNKSLWNLLKPTGNVLQSVRSMVANRLANNGRSWCETFADTNCGTLNNQWMIIDYKQFVARDKPQEGLLWVLEQIPGYIRMEDQTDKLSKFGYWASYNVPFYTDVFNMSGNQALVDKYGDWFTHDKTPRALIFKRDQANVTDVNSLMKLMRSNDYQNDPLSKCECSPPYSAANAIAGRDDLNPINGTYPFPDLGHHLWGAIDAKVVSSQYIKKQTILAVAGPATGSSLPPFQWDTTDFNNVPHYGHPNIFNFSPYMYEWIVY